MPSQKRPEHKIRVYGQAHHDIDIDLLVQIIIMFGRQLADEASSTTNTTNEDTARNDKEET
jgi:hypothetical protein